MTDGFPLLGINRWKVAMNEAVVRPDTSSKGTALVVKQMKTTMYDLRIDGLQMGFDLSRWVPHSYTYAVAHWTWSQSI